MGEVISTPLILVGAAGMGAGMGAGAAAAGAGAAGAGAAGAAAWSRCAGTSHQCCSVAAGSSKAVHSITRAAAHQHRRANMEPALT